MIRGLGPLACVLMAGMGCGVDFETAFVCFAFEGEEGCKASSRLGRDHGRKARSHLARPV